MKKYLQVVLTLPLLFSFPLLSSCDSPGEHFSLETAIEDSAGVVSFRFAQFRGDSYDIELDTNTWTLQGERAYLSGFCIDRYQLSEPVALSASAQDTIQSAIRQVELGNLSSSDCDHLRAEFENGDEGHPDVKSLGVGYNRYSKAPSCSFSKYSGPLFTRVLKAFDDLSPELEINENEGCQ